MICPHCGHENIAGADVCEECLQSLVESGASPTDSRVERRILENPVTALKPPPPVCVQPSQPLQTAIDLMVEHGIGCVLVLEDEQLAGVLTERDVLMKVDPVNPQLAGSPTRDFMTPNPESVGSDASIAFALHKMDVGGYRHLPVVDGQDRPTGVVSVRDILAFLTQEYALTEG